MQGMPLALRTQTVVADLGHALVCLTGISFIHGMAASRACSDINGDQHCDCGLTVYVGLGACTMSITTVASLSYRLRYRSARRTKAARRRLGLRRVGGGPGDMGGPGGHLAATIGKQISVPNWRCKSLWTYGLLYGALRTLAYIIEFNYSNISLRYVSNFNYAMPR
eukprot:6199094-Pleurochrysis_carterae.AAC.3